MSIENRAFGRTGAAVSILGYGTGELDPTWGSLIEDKVADRLLNTVLDGGINLIDTAIDYGHAEELIGRYIGHRRDEYFLASKCGCPVEQPPVPGPYPHDFRPANIRAGTEQSLRRLATDHLDLLQVHGSPSRSQLEQDDTVATLLSLREEGKIRFIGISGAGTLPNLAEHIEMGMFEVFQIPYSAVQREHEELIADAAATGAGILIRGGVARGAPAEDKAWTQDPNGFPKGEARRRWESSRLEDLVMGMGRFEFVLRFTLSLPGLSSTIVATTNMEHLRTNLAIVQKGGLPDDVYAEAKARLHVSPTREVI